MNGNTGLRLRKEFLRGSGSRMYRNRMQSGRGGTREQGNQVGGFGGVEAGNILDAADPVGLYVTGCQKLFGMPEDKQTGVWDFATHQAMIAWLVSLDEDASDIPSWGEAPAWTSKFVTDLVLASMKSPGFIPITQTLLAHIGAPTTTSESLLAFFRGEGAGSETWKRTVRIFDSISMYVIGCEGGVAYGSPAVQTEGIIAAAGAFAGSVVGILLVG